MNYCTDCHEPISDIAIRCVTCASEALIYKPPETEIYAIARQLRMGQVKPQRAGRTMQAIRPRGGVEVANDDEEREYRKSLLTCEECEDE